MPRGFLQILLIVRRSAGVAEVVKGAGLKIRSRMGSWVRIPPPAPHLPILNPPRRGGFDEQSMQNRLTLGGAGHIGEHGVLVECKLRQSHYTGPFGSLTYRLNFADERTISTDLNRRGHSRK